MTWNYRAVKTTYTTDIDEGETVEEVVVTIHEVYYDDNGFVNAMTENPVSFGGETLSELKDIIDRVQSSLEKPVLDGDDPEIFNGTTR